MMRSFYLTLPSFGTGNTIASFRTKLEEVIPVYGHWEVGLAEIIYPSTWMNVIDGKNWIRICYVDPFTTEEEKNDCYDGFKATRKVKPGYYTREELVHELNCVINKFANSQMSKNVPCNKKYITYNNGIVEYKGAEDVEFNMHPNLVDLLGFTEKEYKKEKFTSSLPLNPYPLNFYIYCNLIDPQCVGKGKAQLIGIVPCGTRNIQAVHHSSNPIAYYPLRYDTIDTVEIHIRDSKGELVPFESGHSVVKLHIKQVQQ